MRHTILRKRYLPLLLACLIQAGCDFAVNKRPARIYIPDGYVGWVRIEYGVPNTPALRTDLFGPLEYQKFPPSGLLQTSSELKDGAASAEYFSYVGDNLKPLSSGFIHGGVISGLIHKPDGASLERQFVTFFVGPQQEYEKHKQELEQFKKGEYEYIMTSMEDLPKVGNLASAVH
jgi:hypothetical protein